MVIACCCRVAVVQPGEAASFRSGDRADLLALAPDSCRSIIPRHAAILKAASVKSEITAGLVSSAVAIPLSMAYGMFAFVSLGDEYFAYGAMAGLVSAVIAGRGGGVVGRRPPP